MNKKEKEILDGALQDLKNKSTEECFIIPGTAGNVHKVIKLDDITKIIESLIKELQERR